MLLPRVIVVLPLILCLIDSAKSLKVTKKIHTLLPINNTLRYFDVEDGRLLYASCERNYSKHEKKCQIVGEKTIERSDTYSCNVTLRTIKKHETIRPDVLIHRFGRDRVILLWQANDEEKFSDEPYSMISVIQLKTCAIAEIKFDYRSALDDILFVPYANTFDVFFKHPKFCGTDMCRMTINGRGRVMNGPVMLFKEPDEPYLLESLVKNSSARGYFYVKRSGEETVYTIINPDGSQKVLKQFTGYPKVYTSTEHDFISACATYEYDQKYINCTQYDADGKFKFQTILNKTTKNTKIKFLHNARGGGLLLGYVTAGKCSNLQSCFRNLNNFLAKFDAAGKQIGSKVEKKSIYTWDSLYENERGDYCVFKNSFFADNYLNKNGKNRMRITHDCYEDKDFIKKVV